MHAYHGKDERRIPPLILGHEFSGTSLDGKFKDKEVVINPLISCENCNYCQNKREHLCPLRTMIGMSTPTKRDGGLAELVSVPEQNIFEVPKGLNLKEAALAEPTAVALHAVLLAEANVPYDVLVEPDDVNPSMDTVDVAVVIGANDVVNPSATEEPGSPIYGMPIIEVHNARTVFVLKRSMSSGFAGVQNPLFFKENTRMLFGDAKESIGGLVTEFKE